jgi:hypothetical protein
MMKDWIRKNIDPPGLEKKNRGSLFSLIGRVFGIVRDDAVKTFNAFFPYLADPEKLREHGKALFVPELPYDTEAEYRDRVAAASFYLMRAGERAYIIDQLREHFGDRYILKEDFLELYVQVMDVNNEDIAWTLNFFDEILDPNIAFTISEWFAYIETFLMDEKHSVVTIGRHDAESFEGIKYNGQIKYDGHTVNAMITAYGKYDGVFNYDGHLKYNGIGKITARSVPHPPFRHLSGIVDKMAMSYMTAGNDAEEIGEMLHYGMRYHHFYDGVCKYDGSIKYNSRKIIPPE